MLINGRLRIVNVKTDETEAQAMKRTADEAAGLTYVPDPEATEDLGDFLGTAEPDAIQVEDDERPDEPDIKDRTPTLDEALAHTFPDGFVEIPAAVEPVDVDPTEGGYAKMLAELDEQSKPLPKKTKKKGGAVATVFTTSGDFSIPVDEPMTTLPIDCLRESPTNPRKTFGDLADLTASIRKQGILQPLLVRAGKEDDFEIVSGHRRFRAAQAAGVKLLPVLVRALDDAEVLEAQLTENLQRSDLLPLEEAEGYEALAKVHGHTADEIADRVGKSRAYVYGRMKLLELKDAGRKALADGRLSPSVALLVARIPDEKLQGHALADVAQGDEPMSYRAASGIIQSKYMLRLGDAPFDTKDEFLIPEMGACGPCPFRTGNNRELFGDVERTDVCTAPGCFKRKTDAAWSNAKEQAAGKQQDVMSVAESRKLLAGGAPAWNSGWVELTAIAVDDDEKRTWKKLVGKAPIAVTIAQDPGGKVRQLVKKEDALAAAAEAGHAFAKKAAKVESAPVSAPKETPEEKATRLLDEAAKRATVLAVVGSIVENVEKLGATPEVLRAMAKGLEHMAAPDLVEMRRGMATEGALAKFVEKKASGAQLLGLVFEMAVAEWIGGNVPYFTDELKALARAFKVDVKAVEKTERARIQGEEKRAAAEKLFAKTVHVAEKPATGKPVEIESVTITEPARKPKKKAPAKKGGKR